MFNFLSNFLIMGIGVDDIFVFYDAWLQSAQHHRTLEARLDYAYRRSAHAMAVTSFTDAAAFYTNCLSSITVVKLFGAFMGTLVLVNFFLVVTAFPALIVVRYHLGLDATAADAPDSGCRCCPPASRWRWLCTCCGRCKPPVGTETPDGAEVAPAAADESGADATSSTQGGGADGGKKKERAPAWTDRVATFFGGVWLNGVIRLRPLIVVVALAFFGSSIYLTTTFTPTDRDFRYETFMEDSNVMRFLNQIEYTYEEFGNSATWVDVVYGVAGIDESMVAANDPYDRGGVPIWDEEWTPGSSAAQLGVIDLCEKGAGLGATDGGRHRCFMAHLRDWREALGRPFPIAEADFASELSTFVFLSRHYDAHRSEGNTSCAYVEVSPPPQPSAEEMMAAALSGATSPSPPPPAPPPSSLALECMAIWETAAAHADPGDGDDDDDDDDRPKRLGWHDSVRWSCPASEMGDDVDAGLKEQWCDCRVPDTVPGWAGECPSPKFASPSPWADPSVALSLRAYSIRFSVTMHSFSSAATAAPVFQSFEDLVAEANAAAPAGTNRAMQSHPIWNKMRTEEVMISASFLGCIYGLVICFAFLLVFLRNWIVAIVAVLHILVVILGSVGLMVVYGWRYGFIEGVCVTTVVGFSVDFVAHVSIAYVESSASDRRARTAQALSELGISVMSGALSTVLACFFLTRATMYPFIKLGVFMMSNMALSAIITLVVLPAVLATVGPPIHLGSLTLTGDVLCRRKVTQKM